MDVEKRIDMASALRLRTHGTLEAKGTQAAERRETRDC